jgi:hypothetical protein
MNYNKNKKHTVSYLLGLSGLALVLAFMISPNNNSVLAQQNSINPSSAGIGGMSQYSMSTSFGSQNWTGSISLFSPIIDAFKSKVHTTLNDATTNAIKAVGEGGGGGSNSSAVAAFIHPERGFLVYDVFVLDSSNNIHRVIVDPGNGRVLSNQPMSMMDMMTMAHPMIGMMMGGPPPAMGMMGPLAFPPPPGMMMQHGMMGGPPPAMGMMGPLAFPPPPGMMMGVQHDGWP